MLRRDILALLAATPLLRTATAAAPAAKSASVDELQSTWKSYLAKDAQVATTLDPIRKSKEEWRKELSPAAFHVLREEGTERPFTSPLDKEKRRGVFVCAGCALPLFTSAMKFDSGTGWPSFFTTIPGVLATETDYKLIFPRVEYHCIKCGGHQGHVFPDGPPPTGQRWCNNGVALRFIPA